MSRREFLAGLGASTAVGLGGYLFGIWGRHTPAAAATPQQGVAPADRTLVLIEMGGGNDGLSMVVPHADGRYHDLRRNTTISDPIDLDGEIGLHPELRWLASRYAAGDLAIVEGIGYPDPDLSHFASMSTWWSGLAGGLAATGWLGRYLDVTVGGDDPLAGISIGPGPHPSLLGDASLTVSIQDANGLRPTLPPWIDDADDLVSMWREFAPAPVASPDLFARVQRAITATADAADGVDAALGGVGGSDRAAGLGADLDLAARLITSGSPPRAIVVHGFGDFDTHQGQAARHGALMADLDGGIAGFFATLEAAGAVDRVLVATASEFGRRAADNGQGTDHGTAAAHLVIGPAASGGRHGAPPDLKRLDASGNIDHTLDFRSYYASLLEGWLGVPHGEVLAGSHEVLPLVAPSGGAWSAHVR